MVSAQGNFHVSSHKLGLWQHSSMLAGGDVARGGELRIVDGKLMNLTNVNGQHTPNMKRLAQIVHLLRNQGVNNYHDSGSICNYSVSLASQRLGSGRAPGGQPSPSA
jgi:hypothetical protein